MHSILTEESMFVLLTISFRKVLCGLVNVVTREVDELNNLPFESNAVGTFFVSHTYLGEEKNCQDTEKIMHNMNKIQTLK